MHQLIDEGNGWKLETLADESDDLANPHIVNNTEEGLKGCCFLKEYKNGDDYTAEIRYEEQIHHELVLVEGIVFINKGSLEITENEVLFFKRKVFEGQNSKTSAADYASRLKTEIDCCFS